MAMLVLDERRLEAFISGSVAMPAEFVKHIDLTIMKNYSVYLLLWIVP